MLEGPLFEAGSPVLLTGDDMTIWIRHIWIRS